MDKTEDVIWILMKIKSLEEKATFLNRDYSLPTYRNIWQGSYDVCSSEEDMKRQQEIPKRRMEDAENLGLIEKHIQRIGRFDQIVYKITESGLTYLENNK